MSIKLCPRLENWSLQTADPYQAPEVAQVVLVGEVHNHPVERHYNGKRIQTSIVSSLDLKAGIAETCNTIYELGEPDEHWVAWLRKNGYDRIEDFVAKTSQT